MNQLNPSLDGVDHLNIYSKALTKLGRFLTNPAKFPFYFYPLRMHFNSVEHLWFWLATENVDILQIDSPFNIKPFIKTNKVPLKTNVPNFKKTIVEAYVFKLYTAPDHIFKEFKESTLPFQHYYFYGEPNNAKVIEQPKHHWQVQAWELIRHEINKPTSSFKDLLALAEQFGE